MFDHCSLRNTDFYACKFNKVQFQQCNLNKGNFSQTSLKNVDLSNSTFERLIVSLDELDGCEISPQQAIAFATMLGLKVEE
nr:pentapeptide repeat-containing protein [Roseburia sp. 1XD42-34]